MYKIYCDESWSADYFVEDKYYVFYGILIQEEYEEKILKQIDYLKQQRGLYINGKPVEIKWNKADEEWKSANKANCPNRYMEFLEIFFQALQRREISFGYMFLKKSEYERVQSEFIEARHESCHDFFFMLYFQFLYHCFIRTQINQKPCAIFIDNRNLGRQGQEYEISKLRDILNKKVYRESVPKYQLSLSRELRRKISDSIQFVDLRESKQEPLIQLADLCAGCVRYVLENELKPPSVTQQLSFFDEARNRIQGKTNPGKEELTNAFYRRLRRMKGYQEINLLKVSHHYRFNIFPFQFSDRK